MTLGLHISDIHLKGALLFKDARFKVLPGVTTIYGLNRTNARTSGNGNGAGKSAFFSQVGEILYESPIVGERGDAVKGGQRLLKTIIRDKRVSIDRVGAKLNIKVDGKPKKFRTKPLAKSWLARNLPINQEEFNTYVHIDARIPHPLVMGSSTERKKFFTSFFGLDTLDTERKLFLSELSKLTKVRAAYTELRKEYATSKEKAVEPEKVDQWNSQIKELQAELTNLNAKNVKLQAIAQLLAFEASASSQLKVLAELCPDGVDAAAFEYLVDENKKNLRDNKAGLEDAEAWNQYQRDNTAYTEAYAKLSADALKLISKLGMKEARQKCSASQKRLLYIQESIHTIKRRIEDNEKVVANKLESPGKKPQAPDMGSKEAWAKLESAQHQYKHAQEFKTGMCGTCGQAVEVKSPKKLKARIEELEAIVEVHDELVAYQAAKDTYENRLEGQQKAAQCLKEDKKLLATELEAKQKAKRYADLAEELRDLPSKPPKFEGRKLEVKVMKRMVEEDRERRSLLQFLQPNLDTVLALQGLTEKQRNSGSLAPRLQKRVNDIHEKLSKLRARLEVNTMVSENLGRLRKKLKAMKAELVNEEALKDFFIEYELKSLIKLTAAANCGPGEAPAAPVAAEEEQSKAIRIRP